MTTENLSAPTATLTSAATAQFLAQEFVRHMAPPFSGWIGVRSPTPQGFWDAVRRDAGNGQIVMQLGRRREGFAPPTVGMLRVGWRRRIQAGAGTRFRAVFAAGPITVRPNGGFVRNTVELLLRRVSDGRSFSASARPISHRQSVLEVEVPTSEAYDIWVTGNLLNVYQGFADPYGEIIGNFTEVQRIVPIPMLTPGDDPQALGAALGGELGMDEAVAAIFEAAYQRAEAFEEQPLSDDPQEAARGGLQSF
jgi:hypothetical protein